MRKAYDADGNEVTMADVCDDLGPITTEAWGPVEGPRWADMIGADPWAAQREIEDERRAVLATPGDAHREWHWNAGVPIGTPGCPQDACHPIEDFRPDPEPGEGIRCAHCKGRHWDVAEVRACASARA